MKYINLGGIKLLWGQTAAIVANASGPNYTITFPTSFFSTVQSGVSNANTLNTTSTQNSSFSALSTTSGTLTLYANATTTGQIYSFFVIGS